MLRILSVPGRHHENRFFALLATAMEAEGVRVVDPSARAMAGFAYDVLHLNFPTHYITENRLPKAVLISVLLGSYLVLARLLGRRILYTVHDVVPFRVRHSRLTRLFLRLTHRLTNGFVFLGTSSRAEFVRLYPGDAGTPWTLAPHGPYPTTRLSPAERQDRRSALVAGRGADGERALLVGLLGNIKPYKNVAAIDALPTRLADGRPVAAVVAGRAEAGHEAEVAAVLGRRPAAALIRIDERLSDARLDELIQAVDVVLLPYTKGSNSGVALLVLSNGRPLIGSDMPIFQELATAVGPPWVRVFSAGGSPYPTLAETIEQVAARAVTEAEVAGLDAYLESVSFRHAAREITLLCQRRY